MDCWLTAFVTNLVKALFESALELVSNLSISVSVEDSPSRHSWLGEHLGLDLSIKLTSAPLNVERVWSSAACSTHNQVSSFILHASEFGWDIHEFQVPLLLLLPALLISCECGEEVLAFLHLLVGVSVHDLSQILHEPKVSTHCVSKTSELAELWDQRDLIASLPILVDEERLVWVGDVLIVSGLIVFFIADLGSLLVEGGIWAHAVVNPLDAVGLLIVLRDYCCSNKCSFNCLFPIASSSLLLGLISQLRNVVEDRVSSDNFECNFNIQKSSSLLLKDACIKSWPDFDVVSIKRVCFG